MFRVKETGTLSLLGSGGQAHPPLSTKDSLANRYEATGWKEKAQMEVWNQKGATTLKRSNQELESQPVPLKKGEGSQ